MKVFDTRGRDITVGDEVVYLPECTVTPAGYKVMIVCPEMKVSKVKEIKYHHGTGFAEAGDTVEVILEDGAVLKGDSENGGWGCLKLA